MKYDIPVLYDFEPNNLIDPITMVNLKYFIKFISSKIHARKGNRFYLRNIRIDPEGDISNST